MMRDIARRYFARQRRRLAKPGQTSHKQTVQQRRTDEEWLRDIFEYERTHEIAFASPRALLEAQMIAAMDKAHRRRPRARARVGNTPAQSSEQITSLRVNISCEFS